MTQITVYKRDDRGAPVWHYRGDVIDSGPGWVCVQARFGRERVDLGVIVFERGDVMTEWFYADRFYNIFRVESAAGKLKGWYCNITRPAVITPESVAADDLALDVVVSPDGAITLLDEDEFNALDLPESDRATARNAVEILRERVARRDGPFAGIPA